MQHGEGRRKGVKRGKRKGKRVGGRGKRGRTGMGGRREGKRRFLLRGEVDWKKGVRGETGGRRGAWETDIWHWLLIYLFLVFLDFFCEV